MKKKHEKGKARNGKGREATILDRVPTGLL